MPSRNTLLKILSVTLAATCTPANAYLTWFDVLFWEAPADAPTYEVEVLAKASPDECFDGVGVDYPPLNPDGTCDTGTPKTNEAYVWGLAQAGVGDDGFTGDELWFGTVANSLCVGHGDIGDPIPEVTISWVCEFGESEISRRDVFPLPPALGDWRRPSIYSYDLDTNTLTERTPPDLRIATTFGIRSAGARGNAVLLGGPSILGDALFYAWDAGTARYKGSCRATEINNIRNWVLVNGELFAGIGTIDGRGAVVRWTGTIDDPFNGSAPTSEYCGFEIVTRTPSFPANLASVDDERIAISTWNAFVTGPFKGGLGAGKDAADISRLSGAGVYVSPRFEPNEVEPLRDFDDWTRIWEPRDYEPDPLISNTYDIGAIVYWRGYLWFGTMHATGATITAHTSCTFDFCFGEPADQDEGIELLFSAQRGSSIWRARPGDGEDWEVELLYGEAELPAYVPGTRGFELTATGFTPVFGRSGFGNQYNTYTWTARGTDRLLFGTYDYRYAFDIDLDLVGDELDEGRGYGGDLWRFDDPALPAQPEQLRGMGNYLNYGIRSLIALDGGPDLILGTANAMNLEAEGGWELLRLRPPQ